MDPHTGRVLAISGGFSFRESKFNRATQAKRQPGSAFKPFVYLAALERGLTPDTLRDDAPIVHKGWNPENYSRDYRGPVPLRQALALSLNTVAVRLRLELVGAYAAFANGGTGVVPYVIAQVKRGDGKVLYRRTEGGLGRVVEPGAVAAMNTMMRDTFVIGTARAGAIPGWETAGKTGTSQDFRDAWFVGYSGSLVAGVWLGNEDGEPMKRVTGSTLPVEVWSRFMKVALQGTQPVPLPGVGYRSAPSGTPV